MKADVFDRIVADWGDNIAEPCAALDKEMKGRRGPTAAVPVYAVVLAFVYLGVEKLPTHITAATDVLGRATVKQRQRLGLTKIPTYRQVGYSLDRLQKWATTAQASTGTGPATDTDTEVENGIAADDATGPGSGDPSDAAARVQEILDLLVPASAGPDTGQTMLAVDTTLFNGWCRPVRQEAVASDPDASGRIIDRGHGKLDKYYGYGAVAAVRCDGTGPEVCDRVTLLSAGEDDAEAGAKVAIAVRDAGAPITRVVADRGFSQKPARFQDVLRAARLHVTFDLKSNDNGFTSTFRGADVIDGWLYSPGMPKKLRTVPRPGVTATTDEKKAFAKAMAERARWAFPAHAAPEAHRVRVASPAARGRIRCNAVPASLDNPDPATPTCRRKHLDGEGCTITTTYFGAEANPRTYQFPAWGSSAWVGIYNRRSAVERWFGHLQSDNGVGFRRGRFQVRRITKVAVMTGVAAVATNLRLRWNFEPATP